MAHQPQLKLQTATDHPASDEQPSGASLARNALAAVEHTVPAKVKLTQRYSRAQTQRARRGIALAREALEAA